LKVYRPVRAATAQTLHWLPPQVQDLNSGIVALVVNVVLLVVVGLSMRLAAPPSHVAAE
jgi:solute:Na+ symporter, SSS family